MNKDIKLIQDALASEGRVDGNTVVVPNDFFDRLNRALNPPGQRSVLDDLLNDKRDQ
jgi:hypothetical protein